MTTFLVSTTPQSTPVQMDDTEHYQYTAFDPYSVNLDVPLYDSSAFDGYNLFVLSQYADGTTNNSLVVVDMNGTVVLNRHIGEVPAFYSMAEFVDPYTILVGAPGGPGFWNIINDTWDHVPKRGHHEYEYNPNSDTVFMLNHIFVDINGTEYLYDVIEEVDRDGNVVWALNTTDFVPTSWWYTGERGGGAPDVTHSNTVFYDGDEDVFYYNSRNTNTFFKIDHATKEVIWALGEFGDFTLLDANDQVKRGLFWHGHSVEKISENTFIIFDNDYYDPVDPDNRNSRIVEITINETDMTAKESWTYKAPLTYFCSGWGDADRLPNGNRLGTFGYWGAGTPALVEVNEDGVPVWKLVLPNEDGQFGTYRSERFRFTPILNQPDDILIMNGEPASIDWKTWYNYRTKQYTPGSYDLYLDDVLIQSESFTFDKFWQDTNLTIELEGLPIGRYNATLVVSNDFGQRIQDTVIVDVGSIYLERSGPVQIELGQSNSTITWSGFTMHPVTMNLSINGTTSRYETWTGDDILLDLNSLEMGSHHIVLSFFNASLTQYSEEFWVQIYPSAPPIVNRSHSDITLEWNQTADLSWTLFDMTPREWALSINDEILMSEPWTERNITVDWAVPQLLEGIHEITLSAYDWADHVTESTILVNITLPRIPIIASTPFPNYIAWGTKNVTLDWEIHGADYWSLFKDSLLYDSGNLSSHLLQIPISSWQSEAWNPGEYNLTLVVSNIEGLDDVATTNLSIFLDIGDPYADEFIETRSAWCHNGENAIGAPDGEYATIYQEYGNGYVTLDMGEDEDIIDGLGDDFSIVSHGGDYRLSATDNLASPFIEFGVFSGNDSFDLSDIGLGTVRYVRIEYSDGASIELDAVVAIHFNRPLSEDEPPVLERLEDYYISLGETACLYWGVYDLTPFSYHIYVNGEMVVSDAWGGQNITYFFSPDNGGIWNVTIYVYDLFGNSASDTVLVFVDDMSGRIVLVGASLVFVCVLVAIAVRVELQHSV